MSSESKPTGADAADREAAEALTNMSKPGNQAQVESEEEEDDDAPEPSGTSQGDNAAEGEAEGGKKKKKSKRKKKAKESDVKKAIDRMSPQQIQDLLSLNPSLSRELLEGKADAASGGDPAGLASSKDMAERFKSLKLDEIMTGLASSGKNAKDMASYKFWSTQPVPKFGEEAGPAKPDFEEGPIKKQKVEDIPAEPEPLAVEGFEWVAVNLENDEQIKEVYELLNGHYVEDDEAMFRFNYSTSILRW
jgi:glycylpeptide N-tetradecanoyltransferase